MLFLPGNVYELYYLSLIGNKLGDVPMEYRA